jgi:putative acetyltransferase
MIIRPETPDDADAVRDVVRRAFGQDDEADLVRGLFADGDVIASLVAVVDDQDRQIVGHVLFSRLLIRREAATVNAAALAPLSVVPPYERRGIGSALVNEGLRLLGVAGETVVVVVGDPRYYTRFGFSAGCAGNLRSAYSGPAFMALELRPGALHGLEGEVVYPAAFGRLA